MSRLMDLSSFPNTASTSQEDHEIDSGSTSSGKLRVTLLSSEWRSTKGGLSTINRELAIQLAKHPSVEVSVYLPQCSEEDKQVARDHNVHLIKAREMPGLEPNFWLSCLPEDHVVDCVIGHGAVLGRQVQIIKRTHPYCKWIQVVHTTPEELGMYKEYEEHISRGQDKHQVEVDLCKLADQVVAVGPKLAEVFSGYLRPCGKDRDVLNFTPGIFSEFADVKQAIEEREAFNVLVFGRGDNEDFRLKGYDIAAQAIAELKDMTYKLVFVGATRGEEEKVAKKLVEQGIDPSQLKVRRFNESREKLADLFCEVDLAIMPSRTEGFGLAALEALSAGLPVLVSGNSGLAGALKKVPHGSSCVVTSDDPKDWASAIRAVRDKDREMRLGEFEIVRGAYAKKYSWKEQCDKLVERIKVISLEGSKKGKRLLSSSSTPASKVPKYLRDEGIVEPVANTSLPDDLPSVSDLDAIDTEGEQTLRTDAAPSEFSLDLSPLCQASTSQEGQGNSSSSPSSKELRAVSLKGSKEGERPLTSSSTLASKSTKTLGDEESASETSATDPPQVSARQIRNEDLPAKSKPFGDCQIQVDILLLTVMKEDTYEDCEFLSCLAYLNPDFCKIHHPDLGYVYLGDMGEDDLKLNVAVMKCCEGSSSTGGSIVVVTSAVKVLKPKAVFCVGSCSGLNVTKVSLGDVVVLKKLVTYAFSKVTENGIEELGVKVPLKPHISKLILSAGEGWKPPLKDPGTFEVKIHRGTFLSGPEVVNNHMRCNALIERFPEAVAIEREGEGVYAAAHNLDIEWVVIKGISGYADGRKVKDSWRAFASFMAASLTAHILSDTIAFQALPHYGSASSKTGKRLLSPSSTPASKVPKCLGDEGWDSLVLVKLLKKEYKRRSHLRPLLWDSTIQLPIEQVYTRLKIVSRGKLPIQKEDDEVNVFDIFKVPDVDEDVMTIVEGSPGIGKTTFSLKLAYDWAHGNIPSECSFPKFDFVFLLKCRDIDGDIMEAISEQLLPRGMEKSVEKLLHFMRDIRNQETLILIILDGLDELPEKSRHHVDELLHRRILPFCYVLATSRQERGIEVRKTFVFDIHLEIKGYTENDSIAYVRSHFKTIGQSPKGERLIEEMQQNTFLHALRNNPLNLLLLCVIFEDYEGKLPTSRTELYQVIVQCLLRRYCAKHNLAVPEDNNTLQKRFEEDVLALGELAWACLLNHRQSFREVELAEREVENQNLVARKIGLLYKEESLKRISPQHEYWFLHKTFQEYLAAAFITHKLLRGEFNVFEYTTFDDLVKKYLQVFLFVSGMMGAKATVLFTQIGKKLKEEGFWNWCLCSEQKATFFVESFNESGHAEQMATTLCSILPFPEEIFLLDNSYPFVQVLIACKSFSNLQSTVKLTTELGSYQKLELLINCIESLSKLTTVTLTGGFSSLGLSNADRLCKCIATSKSLSELTLKPPLASDGYVLLPPCNGLALCKTLRKVTLAVLGEESEVCINTLTTGLAPDSPLTSAIVLEIYGSMPFSAIQALQKLLMNKSLISLSLHISGDLHDYLVAAVSEALARQTVLKYFHLRLGGKLSSAGASSLKKGLLKNSSLTYVKVVVHGELPDNWQSVVETLHSTKEPLVTCAFYPNTLNNIAEELVDLVLPENGLVPKQHFSVNVWGKLSCEEAKALCKVLVSSSIALLTLNVHGNLTDDLIISIASGLKGCKTLSFLFVNIWGNLSSEGRTILSALSNLSVHLNVYTTPEESNLLLDISVDNRTVVKTFFAKAKDTSKEKVSLTINDNINVIKEWTHHLGVALAENTSLTSLDLTLSNCLMHGNLGEGVRESLLQSTSIKTLSLTINSCDIEGLVRTLRTCFAQRTSFTTISLEINDYSERDSAGLYRTKVTNILADLKSLSTLSVAVHRNSMVPFWGRVVDYCLRKCTSVKNLSLAFNTDKFKWQDDTYTIRDALAKTTSLNTFSLAICVNPFHVNSLLGCLDKVSASLTTLAITLSLCDFPDTTSFEATEKSFKKGLLKSSTITTLSLTINEFSEGISVIGSFLKRLGVFEGLAQNTSVTTFNLTLNSSRKVGDDWLPGLCDALKKNSSLTTLRLKLNNHCATGESRLYDLRKLALESKSLSLLELEVSFYGKESD